MPPTPYPTEFKVDAILCDSAIVADGKLYIQGGGWNMVTPQQFPARVSRIGLAVVITVPYTATNQSHTLNITLEHEDGGPVAVGQVGADPDTPPSNPEIGAQFNVGRPPILHPGDSQVIPFAVNLDGMEFARPGAYSFVISIDGTEIQRLVFRLLDIARMNLGAA